MTNGNAVERSCWCGANKAVVIGEFAGGLVSAHEAPLTLVRCEGCGAVALHPQPSDAALERAYSHEYYGGSRRKFIGPIAAIVSVFQGGRARLAARHVPAGGRILDVGCGNGGFLMQMQRRGFAVEGTEWTVAAAARVPPDAGIPVHVGDLNDLDLPSNAYDAVTLWHVFEHLRDPPRTLTMIHRLLREGGVAIMSMPNVESEQARRYGVHWLHHDPPRHLFGFGPRSITTLLEHSGFGRPQLNTRSLEQNPFGEIQSALNARGLPRDRLYGMLKGTARVPASQTAAELLRMASLTPMALWRNWRESSRDAGATMTLIARKSRPVQK